MDPEPQQGSMKEGTEGEDQTPGKDGLFPSDTIVVPPGFSKKSTTPPSLQSDPTLRRRTFGNVLRKTRKIRGLSIEKLAEKANVDKGYISRLENAHRNPPGPGLLMRLAEALDIKVELLMMAAGYLELDSQGNPLSELEIIRIVEAELCPAPRQPNGRKELSVIPILKAGDTVIAVGTDGQSVCGKVYLRVATGQVIVDVVEIKNRVESSSF